MVNERADYWSLDERTRDFFVSKWLVVKRYRFFLILSVVFGLFIFRQIPDKRVHVYFCDVGQGDGAVIAYEYFQVLIDTGAYGDKIIECLEKAVPFWDRRIELVILSHSDRDHVGALPEIKKRYVIMNIIESAVVGDVFRYKSLSFETLKGSNDDLDVPLNGSSKSNRSSIVTRLKYGDFSALFTGDIDTENELAMIDRGVLSGSTVLKVAHHGSKYSSSLEFLQTVSAKYAVVSVGKKNSYGHPNSDVLMRLEQVGMKVLRTDLSGTIEISTDGVGVSVGISSLN